VGTAPCGDVLQEAHVEAGRDQNKLIRALQWLTFAPSWFLCRESSRLSHVLAPGHPLCWELRAWEVVSPH
jgi:hypothetical protein